jgi:predicted transcriptional regulator
MSKSRTPSPGTVRMTTNVSPEVARKIDALARQKKVSASWVLARAAEAYLTNSEEQVANAKERRVFRNDF